MQLVVVVFTGLFCPVFRSAAYRVGLGLEIGSDMVGNTPTPGGLQKHMWLV